MSIVRNLIPYVHVADVQRSIGFYERLGFEVQNKADFEGKLGWAYLASADARIMLALATEPVDPAQQAVLFYLYTPDVVTLRERLLEHGIEVGEVTHPDYMPRGEIRVADPDGYVLLIGQLE